MREIIFRAKKWDNSEWVYGDLIQGGGEDSSKWILPIEELKLTQVIKIIPETICQYTGHKDQKGEMIFEKDIIALPRIDFLSYVEWNHESTKFCLISPRDKKIWKSGKVQVVYTIGYTYNGEKCKVIGNLIDNPDLLL